MTERSLGQGGACDPSRYSRSLHGEVCHRCGEGAERGNPLLRAGAIKPERNREEIFGRYVHLYCRGAKRQ